MVDFDVIVPEVPDLLLWDDLINNSLNKVTKVTLLLSESSFIFVISIAWGQWNYNSPNFKKFHHAKETGFGDGKRFFEGLVKPR